MEDEFTYKAQDVSYLGFLETQLRDLQGIATLAYELIQNADDAKDLEGRPTSSWISFDVREEALVVENDGVFRPVDFERLQMIAGGGKRLETATTGAFGLGFLAVYQVTDNPEIFSAGRQWTIHPEAAPEKRIRERKTETDGTRFRLPWAFDPASAVRQTLRLPAVRREALDEMTANIGEALELAALFLRQLQVLEVKREGRLIRRIERELSPATEGPGQQLRLQDESGQRATWLLFSGTFAAADLRARYRGQIEEERGDRVRLALPTDDGQHQGRLFAGLPTETTTPLPLHINADFFPTSDRKRIHFAGGYQAEWNQAALQAAARLLATNLETVRAQLAPAAFWQLLHEIAYTREMASQGELPAIFAAFWQAIVPLFREEPLLYTIQEEWMLAARGRIPPGDAPAPATTTLLKGLAIPLAHPALSFAYELMLTPEVAVPLLTLKDVVEGLSRIGLTRSTPLPEAPPFLAGLESLQALWELLEQLTTSYPTPEVQARERQMLNRVALVLTEEMVLERPDRVFRGGAEARALFPDVAWVHPSLPERGFPGRLVADFGVRQAVERLAEMPIDRLEEAWRLGRLDIPRLFRWFESEQIEIFADDPALQKEIRRLPLCPVAGELRPLATLYIPGGFEDPLALAGTVPMEAVGGRRQFLEDLGIEELSFERYIHQEMPRALAEHPDIPSDARHELLQLLAERLGEIRDDDVLQEQLSRLPLIPCMDGSFRPAREVYATREARVLLGDTIHVAEPPPTQALEAVHHWLGVREEPSATDLVQRLLQLGRLEMKEADAVQTATGCWQRLQTAFTRGEVGPAGLSRLQGKEVVPAGSRLARADSVFFADAPEVVAHFPGLEAQLVAPSAETAEVWALAGVRPLSQAVQVKISTPAGQQPAPALQERIRNRAALLRRIARAEAGEEVTAEFLDGLQVANAAPLQVQYRLRLGDEVTLSPPEPAKAVLDRDGGLLYVGDEEAPTPWLAIAREIGRALTGGEPAGGLVLGIKEVLAAETSGAARAIVDELGYPE